ncbi:VanZ family protein [Arthrobacter sp. ok909]|uniref:VanZ family protein n=1 Tax=Arthrobacter sp. ok909 TaxID=1761746 RepID=UPI0020C90A6A|nr:VanZ family protein [Arthrobacter sp. ok909]
MGGAFILLALIGFWPSPVDKPVQGDIAGALLLLHAVGIPRWINYAFVEASANVVLFIPVGIAATLAFPGRKWWQNAALGLLASACMELGQLLFLSSRFASLLDVATNTAGCVAGTLMAAAMLSAVKERQARRLSAPGLSKPYF